MEKNGDGKTPRPAVGLGVTVINNQGKFLIGLQKGNHGAGEWGLLGGHMEFGETISETVQKGELRKKPIST